MNQIELSQCPEILQRAVEDRIAWDNEHLSAAELLCCTHCEGHPFKDKSTATQQYQVILLTGNLFQILSYTIGIYGLNKVCEESVTIGTVENIISHAPAWVKFK